MTDWLIQLLHSALEHLNYFWIVVLMAIESSFIPFPSEVVVPPAAYKAAGGEMNIILVILFATLGCDIGALINYYLAKYLGRPVVYRFAESRWGRMLLLSPDKVHQAEQYFNRNGAISTLVGRLLPGIRQLISIPAGLAEMKLAPFLLYTTLGAGAWNCILAALGWWLGKIVPYEELIPTVMKYSHWIGWSITALVVVTLMVVLIQRRRSKQTEQ